MSIWIKEKQTSTKRLNEDIETDVLIVGAGMTGLTTAYYLSNKRICVIEGSEIGCGVTINSTAKINYFQETIYSKIMKSRNTDYAAAYLNSQLYATNLLKDIIEKEKIACDFKKTPSYVFASKKREIDTLEKEVAFLFDHSIPIKEKKLPLNIFSYRSYCVPDTYIFNPYKYLKSLYSILVKKGIPIFENTKLTDIKKENEYYICRTDTNKIKTQKIVFAGNYPYFMFPFFLPLKSYIEKSYIIVSTVEKNENCTCINTNTPTFSCRFYEDDGNIYQISLAESHNTAFKQNDKCHFEKVKKTFNLKNENIVDMYSNTDVVTPDYLPYIGEIEKDFYIACGFNTWGMTNSVLSAKIISDSISGIDNPYKKIFSPKRMTLAHLVKIPYIFFSQMKSYLGAKINKNKKWYDGKIEFYKEDLTNYATYTDELGIKHTVINKCPHLGCSLIFNEIEKTWDCPCHSSRFDIDGHVIKGPSNYDISPKIKRQ